MADDGVEIEIGVSFQDDFRRLRQMLYKIEEMKDLIPEWNELEADRIHDEILELARQTIDANAHRSQKNSQSKDG